MWNAVKVSFGLGSLPLLVLLLGAGFTLLRFNSTRRLARASIVTVVALYLVLSLPFTADRLSAGLQGPHEPLPDNARVRRPFAVVVFGGDHAGGRTREAARLYRMLAPDWVVLSCDDEMYEAIVADGVSPDRIVREQAATTTREQALAVVPIVRRLAVDRVVLVASAIHIRRAAAAVRAAGLHPITSPSGVGSLGFGQRTRHRASSLAQFTPAWSALRLSEQSLYEYGALAMYWVRGWLG